MKHRDGFIRFYVAVLTLVVLFSGGMLASAQSQPQSQPMTRQDRDDDVTRRQVAGFDSFLDSHPEVAEALRRDPSLVNKQEFIAGHPELQQYLQQHPEIREELSQNPDAFMHREQRFDRREDQGRDNDVTRREMANMDRFMDTHPEIAEQLRKDPSLVDNKQFVASHPDLQQFLADHPGVREEYKENPNAFMRQEQRFDHREDQGRDNDVTRREMANMDQFMDSHPEIAEQLRKDPSLVDNKQFVASHPDLQQFLADHPGVREEYKENPNAFMRQEQRFDRREDSYMRGDRNGTSSGDLSSFHDFLGSHTGIAGELSKNPSLAANQEYLANHPELRDYLQANPSVQQKLTENPQTFMKSAQPQPFGTSVTPKVGGDVKPK